MAEIGALNVKLGVTAKDFEQGLRGAVTDLDRFERRLSRSGRMIDHFGARFISLGKQAAVGMAALGAASVAGLGVMVTNTLKTVDAQAKLADRVGATIDGFRALDIAAQDAGASAGAAGDLLERMNRRLAEAETGSGTARVALEQLGLTTRDFVGLDADERVALLADRIVELGMSTGQAADILRNFGVRNQEMVNLLLAGGDAIRSARQEVDEYGLSLSRTDALAVEQANDAMARLGRSTEVAATRFTVALAPALKFAADWVNELARQNNGWRDASERAAQTAVHGIGTVLEVAGDAIDHLERHPLTGQLGLLGLLVFGKAGLAGGTILGGAIAQITDALDTSAAATGRKIADVEQDIRDVTEAMEQLAASGGDISELAKFRAELSQQRVDLIQSRAEADGYTGSLEAMAEQLKNVQSESQGFGAGLADFGRGLQDFQFPTAGEGEGGIPVAEIVAPYQAAADAIDEIQTATAEREREMLESRLESVRAGLRTEAEAEMVANAEKLATLQKSLDERLLTEGEYLELRALQWQDHTDRLEAIRQREIEMEQRVAEERIRNQENVQASVRSMEQATFNHTVGLLSTMGQKSKAAAVAAIALSKAGAIAQTIMSTAAGVMNAYRYFDPVTASAWAGYIKALGAAQIGIIAATGLSQAAGSGGAAAGGGGGPGGTATGTGGGAAGQAGPQQTIRVEGVNPGTLYDGSQLIEIINEALERGARLEIAR